VKSWNLQYCVPALKKKAGRIAGRGECIAYQPAKGKDRGSGGKGVGGNGGKAAGAV
jgi:hypothetical protein